jgi:tetratricopeptide (TPR) repeat protein
MVQKPIKVERSIVNKPIEKKAIIALCMIVKDDNDEQDLDRCLDSFGHSYDYLYVAVTGVSGKHQKIHDLIKRYGGKSISTTPETHPDIYFKKDDKWIFANFAAARNVSFDMVDEKVDFLLWADVDDLCTNSEEINKVADRSKELGLDEVFFVYWYAVRCDEQGNVTQVIVNQIRERLLKPGVFKWVSRLHEVCVPKETGYKPKSSLYEYDPKKNQLLVWVHTADYTPNSPTHEKITTRNREILEIQIKEENNKDPRTLFYLAKTYFDLGTDDMLKKSDELLAKYLEMSGWDAERANAHEYRGLISAKNNDFRKCVTIYLKAIAEYPHNHLAYLRLSEAYLNLGALSFAKHWLEVAERMDAPKAGETVGTPFEIKLLAATISYKVALVEQKLPEMKEWAKIRKDLMGGTDDGLYDEVIKAEALNTAATSTFNLSKWLKDNDFTDKISTLIDLLPPDLINQPYMQILYKNIMPPRVWGKKEIAYFASFGGPHFEKWGPSKLETGVGGSETAVLELSKEWAELGYDVTVYCDCGDEEGHWGTLSPREGSVTFVPYYKMNWNDKFNILIVWRNVGLLDHDIKAKKLYFDAHDVASQTEWTQERMDKVDKVFFKSKFHRNNLPELPDSKSVIISNGLRC